MCRILFIIILLSSCGYYEADIVIEDHTNYVATYTKKGHTLTVWMQDSAGNKPALFGQFVSYIEMDTVVYIPHNRHVWGDILGYRTSDPLGVYTHDTFLAEFLIVINPTAWRADDRVLLLDVLKHEYTHHVVYLETGDQDNEHTRREYWDSY